MATMAWCLHLLISALLASRGRSVTALVRLHAEACPKAVLDGWAGPRSRARWLQIRLCSTACSSGIMWGSSFNLVKNHAGSRKGQGPPPPKKRKRRRGGLSLLSQSPAKKGAHTVDDGEGQTRHMLLDRLCCLSFMVVLGFDGQQQGLHLHRWSQEMQTGSHSLF